MDIQKLNELLEPFHSAGWKDSNRYQEWEQDLEQALPEIKRRKDRRSKEAQSVYRAWKGGDIGPVIKFIKKYKLAALEHKRIREIIANLHWAYSRFVEMGPGLRSEAKAFRKFIKGLMIEATVPPSLGRIKKDATPSKVLDDFFSTERMTNRWDGSLNEKEAKRMYQRATKQGIYKGKYSGFYTRLRERRSFVKRLAREVKEKRALQRNEKTRNF